MKDKYTFNPEVGRYDYSVTAEFPTFSISSMVSISKDNIDRVGVLNMAENRLHVEFLTKILYSYIDWSDMSESDINYAFGSFLALLSRDGKDLFRTMKDIFKD